jgi:multidrug resistance efflux pump
MLNISLNSIAGLINPQKYTSFQMLEKSRTRWMQLYVILGFAVLLLSTLFLPWTQNIQAKGYLTTLRPDQKPQAIQSVISGRLEKWYVREGNFVHAGDTIVYISEVKSEYFDPELVDRTAEQFAAKSQSISSYGDKVASLEAQYAALVEARDLKLDQARNKIEQARAKLAGDSIDLVAYQTNLSIAEKQLDRTQTLYDRGYKSLTDLETKKLKVQETSAKVVVQENKLLAQRNELLNLRLQVSAIESEYADKLAKSLSDKYTALSDKLSARAATSKLQNQLANYDQRSKLYYITAPQSGYITKSIKKGIGEVIKEGTDIVTIMPESYELAVEVYVKPMDMPLLNRGDEVRLQFDGWPAVVFSGWPNNSVGTFSGKVFAIDQFISDNGKYRLIVVPDENDKPWPDLLKVGAGTRAFILLNNVPVWYELWRNLNGFPPDFYEKDSSDPYQPIKRKAPLKSVK